MVAGVVRLFVALIAWILVVAVVLSVARTFSFELLYVLSFLGFLAISHLLVSFGTDALWRRTVGVVTALGLVGFLYVVVRQLLETLPIGPG